MVSADSSGSCLLSGSGDATCWSSDRALLTSLNTTGSDVIIVFTLHILIY